MKLKELYAIASAAILSASAVNAQQLANTSFDADWTDCKPWTSSGNEKVVGKTPSPWCASNVYTGSLNQTVVTQIDGYNSTYGVQLKNKRINLAFMGIDQRIPAYITTGTTWSTSIGSGATNKDGGTFGGIDFTYRPDAIQFDYKRINGSGSTQPATVIFYSWIGKTSQADVPGEVVMSSTVSPKTCEMINRDRNILGIETAEGSTTIEKENFELVSKLIYNEIPSANDWTTLTLDIPYESDNAPEMANVIFAADDYFGDPSTIEGDDVLDVDNVKLLYYSRLASLKVNGVDVPGFSDNVYEYTLDTPYSPGHEISFVALGKTANVDPVEFDDDARKVTIKVSNVDADKDGKKEHSYILTFAEPEPDDTTPFEPWEAEYDGSITIDMGDGSSDPLTDQHVIILAEAKDKCTFTLKDFNLTGNYNSGDIVVDNVTLTTETNGNKKYKGSVTGLTLKVRLDPSEEPTQIYADVDVEGTEDSTHKLDMIINVKWLIESPDNHDLFLPIKVTFSGNQNKFTGIEDIVVDNIEDDAPRYFLINGLEVKEAPTSGLYIEVRGNKARKVIVK